MLEAFHAWYTAQEERQAERVRKETEERLTQCAVAGHKAIAARLTELEAEWDIERILLSGGMGSILAGCFLSLASRRWLFLPILLAGALLNYSLTGWCLLALALREGGLRTTEEISIERYALKALRGDFEDIPQVAAEGVSIDVDKVYDSAD